MSEGFGLSERSRRTAPLLAGAAVLAAVLTAALSACAESAPRLTEVPEYHGLRHPPYPAGTEQLTGYLLDRGAEVRHGVAHLRQGQRELLLLNRLVGRDPTGSPRWETLDAVALPTRDSGLVLVLGMCGPDEPPALDPEIIAFVRPVSGDAVWSDVRVAWRADRAAGRFVPERVAGLRCLDEGYDADGAG